MKSKKKIQLQEHSSELKKFWTYKIPESKSFRPDKVPSSKSFGPDKVPSTKSFGPYNSRAR